LFTSEGGCVPGVSPGHRDRNALLEVTFAAGSKLQHIGKGAFWNSPLAEVLLPANLTQLDPLAFRHEVWNRVRFEGPPLFMLDGDFLCLPDSATMARCLVTGERIVVPAHFEVIPRVLWRYIYEYSNL
jgi:hypothetical protein